MRTPTVTAMAPKGSGKGSLQPIKSAAWAVLAAGLALSGCAGAGLPASSLPGAAGTGAADKIAAAFGTAGQRDLSPEEKKTIMAAVALSLRDPKSAKYHWTKFPAVTTESSVNYCATVDAKSPYPAYDGRQAYIVETQLAGGQVISATMGLIAGGKDAKLVAKMCAKYGLDPNKAG